ncbi:MAG: trigger factor [Bacilli bacterium]
MSVKWEKQEANTGLLTVEVDAQEVTVALDEAFKKVQKKINEPGFRKGKFPRPLFEKKYGVEALYDEAIDFLLKKTYPNAIDEAGIDPVDAPEIDIKEFGKGKNLVYTAVVTVKPEVTLGAYKGLEVEVLATEVTEEDVQNEIKKLQEQKSDFVIKEEGTVENGDTAVIDFEGFKDGVAFDGGKGDDYPLVIGSGNFIPGFEEQLIGLATGEEKEIEVTFPEEYHAEDLAGQPVTFKVKVNEIKAKELPELNDAWVKELGQDVETVEALKEKLQTTLAESKKNESESKLRSDLVIQATENATIDVPEAMITREVDGMVRDFENRIKQQGLTLELYFQFTNSNEEALREQMNEEAAARVRQNLTLEAIAKAENIVPSDADVDAEFEKLGALYNMDKEQVRTFFPDVEGFKGQITMQKVVDFLVENRK